MTAPAWETEVDELHEFFEALFLGQIATVDRAAEVFADDFTFVGPDGVRSDRSEVLAMLQAGQGHSTTVEIAIEGHRTIVVTDDVIVAEYIEVHRPAETGNRRRTTVVFGVDPSAPNGVTWRHAHETFLAATET